MKISGQVIELDPTKKYIMLVRRGSVLAKTIHVTGGQGLLKNGRILFTDTFEEFKLIENSDRIVNIMEESE